MEKLIYALWDADDQYLLAELPNSIGEQGGINIRINIQNDDVAEGAGLIQSRGELLPNAILQFWMPSSNTSWSILTLRSTTIR